MVKVKKKKKKKKEKEKEKEKEKPADTLISIHVHPRSSKEGVLSFNDGFLHVRLRSAPLEGKANEELLSFLADFFKLKKSGLRILRGEKSRQKIISLQGIDAEMVSKRIGEELAAQAK